MEIRVFGDADLSKVRELIAPVIKIDNLEVTLLRIHSTLEILGSMSKWAALIEIHANTGGEDRTAYAITKALVAGGFHVLIHWKNDRCEEFWPHNRYIPSEYKG